MRRIEDIRIYFSTKELEAKFSFVSEKRTVRIPFRFASKLRETGFALPKIDHVYIEIIGEGPLAFSLKDRKQEFESCIRTVNTTVSAPLAKLNFEQQHDFIVHLVSDALKLICSETGVPTRDIEVTERLMLEHRERLGILLTKKSTPDYDFSVSFRCSPPTRELEVSAYGNGFHPYNVSGVLRITDKKHDQFRELSFFDGGLGTLDSLVGRIVVTGDLVTFKPKTTSRAARQIALFQEAGNPIPEFSISSLLKCNAKKERE